MMQRRLIFLLFSVVFIHFVFFDRFYSKKYFLIKSLNNAKIINPHSYKYVINQTKFCAGKNLLLIAFVAISPQNFEHRKLIRETWSNKTLFPQIETIFTLGLSSNQTVNQKIKEENEIYKDILQEDFMDTYDNLTLKTIMGLKWVSEYCSNAKFTLKIDDDVVVNTPVLIDYLQKLVKEGNYSNQYMGSLMINARVIYDTTYKWYVKENEFNSSHYPQYHQGPAYMMSTDMAKVFYNMSLYTSLFRFEDVYVGILAENYKNLRYVNIGHLYIFENPVISIQNSAKNEKLFSFYTNFTLFNNVWKVFLNKSNLIF